MTQSKRRRNKSKPQSRKSRRPANRDNQPPVAGTKTASILKLLSRSGGVTIQEIVKATGWQAHSVRGFLAGQVRKKLGLTLSSEKGPDSLRRYKITRDGDGNVQV